MVNGCMDKLTRPKLVATNTLYRQTMYSIADGLG